MPLVMYSFTVLHPAFEFNTFKNVFFLQNVRLIKARWELVAVAGIRFYTYTSHVKLNMTFLAIIFLCVFPILHDHVFTYSNIHR